MKLKTSRISVKNLKAAHKIYNYYIKYSFSNFEERVLTFSKFYKNYKIIVSNNLPYILAIEDEVVVGLAYLNSFREKSGYKYSFENTIYLHKDYLGRGIGAKLLSKLIVNSKKNKNIKKIVAVIGSIDSKVSVKLHKKLGFKKVGLLKKIGFKKGKWIDSIFMQKDL
mgnify:CR=1 FL=1|tara:strand:- start:12604 stop:13104 length:501 start_codon:yes stop_codon:yes gene_type:complete